MENEYKWLDLLPGEGELHDPLFDKMVFFTAICNK